MWTIWAVSFAACTIISLFAVSLLLSKRETMDEVASVYDMRHVRRFVRRLARFRPRFQFGSFLWLTAYAAMVSCVLQALGRSAMGIFAIPLLTVAMLLTRVAVTTLSEPSVRRTPSPIHFPNLDTKNDHASDDHSSDC